MGIMGSGFGRALAGAGAGVAALSAKYIDEELAANKARLLADLQQQSFERQDAYTNDPARRERLRAETGKDERQKSDIAFEDKVRELTDPKYTGAVDARYKAQTPLVAEREGAVAGAKPYDLSPGQERYQGKDRIATNTRATPQEVQDGLYRDEIKRSSPNGIKLPEAVKIQAEGMRDRLKSIEKLMDEGMASGDLLDKPPTDPKKADAYERFKRLDRTRRVLAQQMDDIIAPYAGGTGGGGGGGGGRPDPLGLRGGGGSGGGAAAEPGDIITDKASGQPVSKREKTRSLMDAIAKDMEDTGTTQAVAKIAGQTIPINGAKDAGTAPEKKPAAPAAPAGPSLFDRLMKKFGESTLGQYGTDYTSPEGKKALAARVAEAKKGGQPLTEVETLRARQAGLI